MSIGHFLGATLPDTPHGLRVRDRLPVFAVWAWREGTTEDNVSTTNESRFALLTVVSSFVLAEMSDKTTLATLTLASDHDWAGVWIGSTLGMILADGLAIGVGTLLHQRLPAQLLHVLASLLFLLFGLWMLFDSALGWRSVAIAVATAVALVAAIVAVIHGRKLCDGAGLRPQSSGGHRTSSRVPTAPTPSPAVWHPPPEVSAWATRVQPGSASHGPASSRTAKVTRDESPLSAGCPGSGISRRHALLAPFVNHDEAETPHTLTRRFLRITCEFRSICRHLC